MIGTQRQFSCPQIICGLLLTLASYWCFPPQIALAQAQSNTSYHYVANTRPPDPFLSLRTHPTTVMGQRIMQMPNGTVLDVLQQRPDGWWFVRVIPTGQEGWALSGDRYAKWIDCCVSTPQQVPTPGSLGFRSPSNNIHCMIDDFGLSNNSYPPYLRCDIYQVDSRPPPRPATCQGDWGQAFSITADGMVGQRMCYTDAVMNDQWPILAYGAVWQQHGFTCTSEPSGVTCFNARRRGFTLSRRTQTLF